MKNIDQELINWAVEKITKEYKEDVSLLIGQKGACKLPTDEQTMAFDFFIPATERGNQLARTFIIEDMGYDLYPMSWERIRNIAELNEPSMIFAFAKGEVLYSRNASDEKKYEDMKQLLVENLADKELTFSKGLQSLNTAMEIFQTMMFEDSLCSVRKASGGIISYLMNAIAMVNGTYLENGYGNLKLAIDGLEKVPSKFDVMYEELINEKTIVDIRMQCQKMIQVTRDFFVSVKPCENECEKNMNYDDLVDWYQEARYSFRKISYYAGINSAEDCFLLGCYLQIEFDAIKGDFGLEEMDLLGSFQSDQLDKFALQAENLEKYIISIIEKNHAARKNYKDLEEFLKANNGRA